MNRLLLPRVLIAWVTLAYWSHGLDAQTQTASDSDTGKRVAWTTSRVQGTPDTPLPLSLVPAFDRIKFNDPMHVRWQPDVGRYFVCELAGKIWTFPHDPQVASADLAVDFKESLRSFDPEKSNGCDQVYSIAFDPDFAKNRYIYVCIVLSSKTGSPLPDGSRISRFRLTEQSPPKIDVGSELPIITWLAGGHNGCDLAFDNSGCLLVSTGDATEPSPPDRLRTGQDCSDLLSSILRIDVRGATVDRPYTIPKDNPFVGVPNVREEIWAFGFRNPWRITIDPPTGRLYLGDVGWEKWELVHHVLRGGNYGWSVREGNELLLPNETVGPAPILPTRVMLPHADAASVTGGFVYRGSRLPIIQQQYLFGDWITGRIWALPLDDTSPHREVASGQLRIIAFAPDRDGEPLVVNHLNNTTLFKLVANENFETESAQMRDFPRMLSQTGIFEDTAAQRPRPGVRPFSINQPQWQDGAISQHYLALPGTEQVVVYDTPQPVGSIAMFNSRLDYPAGTVLAKTISMPPPSADAPTPARKLETQLLHFDGRLWRGYSYVWNEAQTDAQLAPAGGMEFNLPLAGTPRWRVHSRVECMQCHNPWPETTLAFTPEQLHQASRGEQSTWHRLVREGFVVTKNERNRTIDPEKCVRRPLSDTASDPVEHRARSYLHANCAHCHQPGAGAAVDLSLKIGDKPNELKALDVVPTKGQFDVQDARLVAPGDAPRSVLLLRMASAATGRMPHIGSREVDFKGVALISQWIEQMKPEQAVATEKSDPAKLANHLLATTQEAKSSPALALAIHLAAAKSAGNDPAVSATKQLPHELLAQLAQVPDPVVSSLFEAFVPVAQRQRRLGPNATFADLSDLTGDAATGQKWFFDQTRSQCSKCHRVGTDGGQIGPDLTQIGKKLTPAQLFEALADPSRVVDPKYQSHTFLLADGKVVTGLLESESPREIVLFTSQGEKIPIAVKDIESRKPDTKSIMPSGMMGELTAQQTADLLAFLSGLK